jgi:hypothetical protein
VTTSIATISDTFCEKLQAIAAAEFDGIEVLEIP